MSRKLIDRAIDLIYADLDEPGYGRRRQGRGFSYLQPDGKRIEDRSIIDRCKSLVIPPAWADVWICMLEAGHIQSTGVDEKGRKQYLYHELWTEWRNQDKFDRLGQFARQLGNIREAVDQALDEDSDPQQQMIAAAVRTIDRGLIRVGNESYAKENKSYGATTLRSKHLDLRDDSIVLDFKAKSGTRRQVEIEDPDLAAALARSEGLPGQRLFQYRDGNGDVRAVDSSQVNQWLKAVTGIDGLSAKSFRTWGGTVAAWEFAHEHRDQGFKRLDTRAIRHAADRLGNTVSVSRAYYVHPALARMLKRSEVPPRARRRRKGLSIAETSVIRFLESLER